MKTVTKYFKPPFHSHYQYVYDSEGRRVLDVRGWGFLTGALDLDPEDAVEIRDKITAEIVAALNSGGEE